MDSNLFDLIILIIFTLLSAFFSGSETALFSLTKSNLHKFSISLSKRERILSGIMSAPEKILITILVGNLFVNIVLSAISTKLLLNVWSGYGHFISIAIVSIIVIIFCEISPKIISMNNYESLSKMAIPILNGFHKILMPLRELLLVITNGIIKMLNLELEKEKMITEEELDMAIRIGEMRRVISKEEFTFIQNVLRFSKKDALNVMIPRNIAVFIPFNATIEEAVKIFLEAGVVRAPVFKEDRDNIVGVLDSRELVPYVRGYKKAKNINKLIHNIYHYPASKELGELLKEFLMKKIQIAIVIDEYGGTAGVVTLSSIISELMGRDFTLGDKARKSDIRQLDDETCIISGDMQIDDFNFSFSDNIESTDSETIGGYIIEKLGYFPKRKEKLITERHVFKIRNIKKNRIESIELIPRERG
ncbi:MAG: hemolysin family protein [Spirochaetota bacterium]|nr:hemolysin family protein [Spirochaetota bacterium]